MSRIHEALKKAEQERASGQIPDLPMLTSEPRAFAPASLQDREVEIPPVSAEAIAAATGGFLRFDDLVKRCSHPKWNPDPNVNVFLNPDMTAHGAEQFRTLRSRLYQIRGAQTMKTLLVTSSIPSEGKTFVTNNLAQSIVRQPDRRVLANRCGPSLLPVACAARRSCFSGPDRLSSWRGRRNANHPTQRGKQSVLHPGRKRGHQSERAAIQRPAQAAAGSSVAHVRLDHLGLCTSDSGRRLQLPRRPGRWRSDGCARWRYTVRHRTTRLPGIAGTNCRGSGLERRRSGAGLRSLLFVVRLRVRLRSESRSECGPGAPELMRRRPTLSQN